MREIAETICFRCERNLIANPHKFKAEITSAPINACTPGALTNMQNILHAMSDSLYPQKYLYISNLANEYVRKYNLAAGNILMEVHKVNELIHEVSREYKVIPPLDINAIYRDLDQASTNATKAAFKDYLNNHFSSKEGVNNFIAYVAGEYAAKLPEVPESGFFPIKQDGADSPEFEKILNIADDLALPLDTIITFVEQHEDSKEETPYKEFKYKDDYLEVIELGVMLKLRNEGILEHRGLNFQEMDKVSVWDGLQKAFTEKMKNNNCELIQSLGAWYRINEKDRTIEKLFDTKTLKSLTVDGINIEDYLYDKLQDRGALGFSNALATLLEEKDISAGEETPFEKLLLLSDQGQEILKYFDSHEEFFALSDQEFANWQKLCNSYDKLQYIAVCGDAKMLERFCRSKNITDEGIKAWRDNQHDTLLHIAAGNNNTSIISKLIELGINLDAPNELGRRALDMAVEYNSIEAIRKLLASGAKDHQEKNLHKSTEKEQIEVIKELLAGRAAQGNVSDYGSQSLHWAVKKK